MPSELPVVGPVQGAISSQDTADMAFHCCAHAGDYEDAVVLLHMLGLKWSDCVVARQQLQLRKEEKRWDIS